MIERMILLAASALFIRLVLLLVEVALTPAARLRLSLFRPWRGDPWPIGVQEDDDLRFRWRAALTKASGGVAGPDPAASRVARRPPPREAPMAAAEPAIEDLPGGTVPTERPDRITVHRA